MKTKQLPFYPLGTQLLLEPVELPEKIGMIYLPEKVRHPVNQGRIIATGENVPNCSKDEDTDSFAIGNIVVFPLYADSTIEMDNKRFMVVSYDQVLMSDFGYFASAMLQDEQQKKA